MASTLTPSNLIHIMLDVIQLVAMVLLALQRRGLGECAAGETAICLTGDQDVSERVSECECVHVYGHSVVRMHASLCVSGYIQVVLCVCGCV